jgi:hypothetical protein
LNPVFPTSVLIPLSVLAIAIAASGAWRGSVGLSPGIRGTLMALRLLAVAAAMLILFNPGKWVRPMEEQLRPWVLLIDRSASMAQLDGNASSRYETASAAAATAIEQTNQAGIAIRLQPFDQALHAPVAIGDLPDPSGEGSRILPAVSQVLEEASAVGESLAGLIVISDGRQTLQSSQTDLGALALRARSRNLSIHTVAIGTDGPLRDVILQSQAAITAFPDQPLRIPFTLQSSGFEPLRQTVTLTDGHGVEVSAITLDLEPGATATSAFEVTAPSESARWSIGTAVVDGEVRSGNNRTTINIRVLASRTRVFLAEGAPYWDSKFLAQLLRQQPHMEVHSVHRLSDQRYFRIDSGSDDSAETHAPVFPATLDELSHYDLIVFGKNIDPFLDDKRAEALRAYVRDRGGAVLFARGKPATASLPALEPLEPVVWATSTASDFGFAPTRDGEAAGLFGEALPGPDASLWASLPTLKDGRQISMVKPFTRVLAEGISTVGSGQSATFPALLVRRYGQGVTGLVNGDGLWKWDFFPEARDLGNCYEEFWTQLIQWMASYSEFLPGQDFSLRLPATRGEAGVALPASLSYRGAAPVPEPVLVVTAPDGEERELRPAAVPDPTGRPLWRSSFTPDRPGAWKLHVIDPRDGAPPTPEVTFTVPVPPAESDDVSPDPDFLVDLAEATGGQAVNAPGFSDFLKSHLIAPPPATRDSGAVWKPMWSRAPFAILIGFLLSSEWFLRRRQGLA